MNANKQKTLERLFVRDNRIMNGKYDPIYHAEPVSELELFFLNNRTQELEQEIVNRAPESANAYMMTRHSYTSAVGYPGLVPEIVEDAPNFSVYGVQYWKTHS